MMWAKWYDGIVSHSQGVFFICGDGKTLVSNLILGLIELWVGGNLHRANQPPS